MLVLLVGASAFGQDGWIDSFRMSTFDEMGRGSADVTVIGSGESGMSIPHPTNPHIVYHLAQSTLAAGGLPMQRVNLKTGQWEHRNVWPMPTFGEGQSEAKYRFNWHAPIVVDPFDENTLYTAAEVVFRIVRLRAA